MFPLWTAFLVAIALVAGGVWVYRRYFRKVSGREDRYTPERILTPEQVAMLDYLRDTFPDQVVLPNVPLQNMLSVRRSADIQRAKERLKTQKVDFVVCDADGRAVFAFDVEQYHLSDAKAKAHQVKIKNRILKTAGVRFLFLKNSIHRMPTPNDFRRQLDLAALPRPKAQDGESNNGESVRQQLESKFSEFDTLVYPSTGFKESEVMGLSGLMELGEARTDRKSQHERQIEAVRRRA
ncbi:MULTISPECIES: DUF2726 domain-containing protein [Hydrogenophaga]|jgi:hypothetical protein|uniref:DUF2726 domain-containing protein n=1 Tax=Hydrogenophaga pseudoflava TaxID=47421 RepID=A0A4P6X4D4_HYDPS|nr:MULTISPECIES: DUF2726 domain-containing protein [Hydrogenophaga]OPF62450.1 hypothetical protein BC358_13790 [Hydrogenophaga sp. H7]QBM30089.1 hypothetical protein HPF_20520 [Hydrogenophaga pseudoflava]